MTTPHVESWASRLGHLKGKKAAGLEIGCCEGRSSIWFLQNILTHPESTLTCVDPWAIPGLWETFMGNIRESGVGKKVKIQRRMSHMMANTLIPPLDFVYVDGDHRAPFVLMDALVAWRFLKPGGVLIFDDYLLKPMPNGSHAQLAGKMLPQNAIDFFIDMMEGKYIGVTKSDQVIGVKAS